MGKPEPIKRLVNPSWPLGILNARVFLIQLKPSLNLRIHPGVNYLDPFFPTQARLCLVIMAFLKLKESQEIKFEFP